MKGDYLIGRSAYDYGGGYQPQQQSQQGMTPSPSLVMRMLQGNQGGFGSMFGGGESGLGSYLGTGGEAGGIDAAGSSGLGGGSGAMGSLGPIAAIAAAVALTKGIEHRSPNSGLGKVMRTFNAPSLAQIKEDPGKGILGAATGLFPFLNHKMNKKAKEAKPEWESLLGM